MAYVFRGGIYFGDNRKTRRTKIERLTPPERLRVPLCDNKGASLTPTVSVGDAVLRGDLIGEGACAVHSPVSGKVVSIGDDMAMPGGKRSAYVEIENDMQYTVSPAAEKCDKRLADCESSEIIEVIRRAGICDTNGEPLDKKLTYVRGSVEYCIINCVFDEPYVNGERRLTNENPAAVINGLKIILKALRLRRGLIVVGEGDSDTIRKLRSLVRGDKLVGVSTVRAKYPGGGERELIYSVIGRELPEGKTPIDAGCVVFGALTAANVFSAFASGMPFVSRVVTVDGDAVTRPVNLMVPIGTPFSELVAHAGGLKRKAEAIISGGPLRGELCDDLDTVVTKTTSAVLVFSRREADVNTHESACIRCGRCMSVCPMRIVPHKLYKLIREGKYEKAVKKGALLCDECGACAYICPGKVPITGAVRHLKAEYNKEHNEPKTSAEGESE